MKRSILGSVIALVLIALAASGCAHRTASSNFSAPRGKLVALAVTVEGGGEATPMQWAAVVKAVQPHLVAGGWMLIKDYANADSILRVEFVPSAEDPNIGRAITLSFRANPLKALAYAASRNPTIYRSASYSSYNNSGFHNFYGYDRYDRFYDHYYAYYTTPSRPGNPTTPPTRGHRRDDDCPPEVRARPPWLASTTPVALNAPPAVYASYEPSYRTNNSYSRSAPSSNSYFGSSSSSSSYSEPSSYSSSSSSSSSYTPPASSYSAPAAQSSSSYFESSSSSSSSGGGSSGTTSDSSQTHKN
jgi:hypothetical protein